MPKRSTKLFLDGGDPQQTKQARQMLGFLDGQTTNPSLVAKHPSFQKCLQGNKKCSEQDIWQLYKNIVQEMSPILGDGSVSIEVYADQHTTAQEMVSKGSELFSWIPNAHVKVPATAEGVKAAQQLLAEGVRVNFTLVFSQQQAAAIYAATKGAKKGDVFLSPFIGRLDDIGQNGMSLIENILKMYQAGDGHVEVLVASVRNQQHFAKALQLKADAITAPYAILEEWHSQGMPVVDDSFVYKTEGLADIEYQDLDLEKDWQQFDIKHQLTDKGIEKFAKDWNAVISSTK